MIYLKLFAVAWLCTGIVTVHAAMAMPGDEDRSYPVVDVPLFVLFLWCVLLCLIAGPLGLGVMISVKRDRLKIAKRKKGATE